MKRNWIPSKGHLKKDRNRFGYLLVVFTLFGFFGLPPIVKSIATRNSPRPSTGRSPSSRSNSTLMPFPSPSGDSWYKEKGSSTPFVSFEELYVNLQSISALKFGPGSEGDPVKNNPISMSTASLRQPTTFPISWKRRKTSLLQKLRRNPNPSVLPE